MTLGWRGGEQITVTKWAIVIFPQHEHLTAIEEFRSSYDPLALSIPAHLTLVFPFESALSAHKLGAHVAQATQQVHPFRLCLQGVRGQASEYLFLNVTDGYDQVMGLHDQLYTGVLAPYLSVHETYVPHMTISRVQNTLTFAEALRRAEEALPDAIQTTVNQISAYAIEPDGKGQVVCKVPLSGA
jgi:2'-5' RNA ligase